MVVEEEEASTACMSAVRARSLGTSATGSTGSNADAAEEVEGASLNADRVLKVVC